MMITAQPSKRSVEAVNRIQEMRRSNATTPFTNRHREARKGRGKGTRSQAVRRDIRNGW